MKLSSSVILSVATTLASINSVTAAVLPSASITSDSCIEIATKYVTTRLDFPESIPSTTSTSTTSNDHTTASSTETTGTSTTVETSLTTSSTPESTGPEPTSISATIESSLTTSGTPESAGPEPTGTSTTPKNESTELPETSITSTVPETDTTTDIPQQTDSEPTSTSTATTTIPETETTSSSTSSASPTQSLPADFDFKTVYLNKNNEYRALMKDTNPLVWNEDLAVSSQDWADKHVCGDPIVHSGNTYKGEKLGENIAYGYNFIEAGGVTSWFNEIVDYNFNDPVYSSSTGHFTQLVWAASTEIGCGYKYCGEYYGNYVVCEYNPEGNIIFNGGYSEFTENVHRPIDDSTYNGV